MASIAVPDREAVLRPLLMATIASGVLVLGLLQFFPAAAPLLEHDGLLSIDRAVRIAFFGFFGCTTALLAAMTFGAWRSPRLATAFNAYGALAFIVSALLVGGQVGGAMQTLHDANHSMTPLMSMFFLFNLAAVIALAALGLVMRARRAAPGNAT